MSKTTDFTWYRATVPDQNKRDGHFVDNLQESYEKAKEISINDLKG